MINNQLPSESNAARTFLTLLMKFSVASWVGLVLGFISVPLTTRLFTPDQIGRINMFYLAANFISIIVTLGLDHSYVRFYNEPPRGLTPKKVFTICLILTTFSWLIVSIILVNNYSVLSAILFGETDVFVVICLAIFVLANVYARFLNLTYRMSQNIRGYTILSLLIILFGKLLYIASALCNPTYKVAILFSTLSMTTLVVIYFIIQKDFVEARDFLLAKAASGNVVVYGFPLVPAALLSWLSMSIPQIFILKYMDFNTLGIFSTAASIAGLLSVVQVGFNTYWVAYVLANYKNEQKRIINIHDYITFVMVGLALLIIILQDVIFMLVGKDYQGGRIYFPFLMWPLISATISETTVIGVHISKRTSIHIFVSSATVITNVFLGLWFIKIGGAIGMAIAVGCSGLVLLLIRTIFGQKYYKSINDIRLTILAISLLILASFANLLLHQNLTIRSVITLSCLFILIILYNKQFKRIASILFITLIDSLLILRKNIL